MCNVHCAWMKILNSTYIYTYIYFALWYPYEQWTLEWNINLSFESNTWFRSVKHQKNLPSISAICFLLIWNLRSVSEYIGNAPPYWSLNILTQCFFSVWVLLSHIHMYSYPTSFSVYKYVNQRESHCELLYLICDLVRLILLVVRISNNITFSDSFIVDFDIH